MEKQMSVLKFCLAVIAAYLLGSISVAVLLTKKQYKQDVRGCGSGNAGATNVARVFGMKAGVITFIGDLLKTAAAVTVGGLLLGETGKCAAAAACLIGHCYPVFFGFRGGKGVTVSAAVALVLDVRFFLFLVAVFFLVSLAARTLSVSSVSCAIAYPVGMLLFGHTALAPMLLSAFVTVFVIFLHRANIKRILSGTEPKFKAKNDRAERR